MAPKSSLDLKELVKSQLKNSPWINELSQHLTDYEKRVKSVVKDLDLKGRDAREKSREQLDSFARQLKKTRADLEKRVMTLVNQEAKRLNEGFNELVAYLKSLSACEKVSETSSKKVKAKAKTTTTKKKIETAAAPRTKKASGSTKSARRTVTSKSRDSASGSGELTSSLPV